MNSSYKYNTEDSYYTFDNFIESLKANNLDIISPDLINSNTPNEYETNIIDNSQYSNKSPVIEDLFKEKMARTDIETKYKELLIQIQKEKDYSSQLEKNINIIKEKYEKDIELIDMSNIEKDKVINDIESEV